MGLGAIHAFAPNHIRIDAMTESEIAEDLNKLKEQIKNIKADKNKAVDVLIAEYKEIRAELRNQSTLAETAFRFSITSLVAIVGTAISFQVPEIIHIIPTLILVFTIVQFQRISSIQMHGFYLLRIEEKIKALFESEEILMEWEIGDERKPLVDPLGPQILGYALIGLIITILFVFSSYFSFFVYPDSQFVHIGEFIVGVSYPIYSARLLKRKREQIAVEGK